MQRKGFLMLAITTLVTSLVALTLFVISIDSGSTQKVAGGNVQQIYTFVKKWGGEGTFELS